MTIQPVTTSRNGNDITICIESSSAQVVAEQNQSGNVDIPRCCMIGDVAQKVVAKMMLDKPYDGAQTFEINSRFEFPTSREFKHEPDR